MSDPDIQALTDEIAALTNVRISAKQVKNGELLEVKFWFSDLSLSEGPLFHLRAEGLHRHSILATFGGKSEPLIRQIQSASEAQIALARDLLGLLPLNDYTVDENLLDPWVPSNLATDIRIIKAKKVKLSDHLSQPAIQRTVSEAIAPLIAAMAELIGYEEELQQTDIVGQMEGAIVLSTVIRRERSARNRLLCLSHHGEQCVICGINPVSIYGLAGSILEVHHIQPLSSLDSPKTFDPKTDLIPVCPNCHRAIHTRRPIPWSPQELKSKLNGD